MTAANRPMQVYEEGFLSGLRGEDPRVCPYEKATVEHQFWNDGQRRGAVFHRYANGETVGQSENGK